ncbi:MAG: 30S ribosomal protein S8 [Caldilineaceae bacterium]|nr:30S ribosomal protein S8 [Caldilineaceae bacterium]
MMTDPIADFLTRVRNSSNSRHRRAVMPSSRAKVALAKILAEEGFISGYSVTADKARPNLIIGMKYSDKGQPVISGIERVSRPGRRTYTGYRNIPLVRSGLGINIVSTPKGVMSGTQARRERVGGEIMCNIW